MEGGRDTDKEGERQEKKEMAKGLEERKKDAEGEMSEGQTARGMRRRMHQ